MKYQGVGRPGKQPADAGLLFVGSPVPKRASPTSHLRDGGESAASGKEPDSSIFLQAGLGLPAFAGRFRRMNITVANVRLTFRSTAVLAQKA
jgi:hypothetical protein